MPKRRAKSLRRSTQVPTGVRSACGLSLISSTARGAIEDEFARKLLALSKKPLGSVEFGSLKSSLDVLRLEVESMAKAHQNIANQMKTELDEPLTAFSGAMRERRKIVQGGTEKLLKLKMQQTQTVNKVISLPPPLNCS